MGLLYIIKLLRCFNSVVRFGFFFAPQTSCIQGSLVIFFYLHFLFSFLRFIITHCKAFHFFVFLFQSVTMSNTDKRGLELSFSKCILQTNSENTFLYEIWFFLCGYSLPDFCVSVFLLLFFLVCAVIAGPLTNGWMAKQSSSPEPTLV